MVRLLRRARRARRGKKKALIERLDAAVRAYVAASAASAPPPRGLPLAPAVARGSVAAPGAPGGAFERLAAGDGGGVGEDEAVAAFTPGPPVAEDGPPLEDLEAQMGGEVAARDASAATGVVARPARRGTARGGDGADDDLPPGIKNAPLPELDALVARLPAELRETLEDLLRARFVAVKRVPGRDLSAPSAPEA